MQHKLMVYVPTLKRVDFQFTLRSLPKEWQERTTLVCPANEAKIHGRNWPSLYSIQSPPVKDICQTRAWIFKNARSEKIMVMDDDLILSVRKKTSPHFKGYHERNDDDGTWTRLKDKDPDYAKLVPPTPKQADAIFQRIDKMLDTYRHGGISERYFNNTKPYEFVKNAKLLHALAYHVPTVLENCKIGWTKWHEDVDYTIQLLLAGYENALYNWAAVNEGRGWNAPGGCSSYRVFAEQRPCAEAMAKHYPGIAIAYEKKSKAGPMWVVKVNWKKAIAQGRDE